MSYNGSGTFQINSSGQPVVTGTVISSTAFNALTADLATGLSTAITKDGQTTTTVRVPFAQGISSTLVTDATSATTGSIITAGGISTQKALWVGTTSRLVGNVQADANVLIGTSTNYSPFAVNFANPTGSSGNGVLATFRNAQTGGTNTGAFINFENAGVYSWSCGMPAAGNSFVWLNGSNVEKMRLDLNGNLGIGMTPVNILDITQSANAASKISLLNATSGTAGRSQISLAAGTATFDIYNLSQGYTTSGLAVASGSWLRASGQMSLSTDGASPIVFGINGAEKMRLSTVGSLGIGCTVGAVASNSTNFPAVQVGAATVLMGRVSGSVESYWTNDIYYDGTNYRYINGGAGQGATFLYQNGEAVIFYRAPSGGSSGGIATPTVQLNIASNGAVTNTTGSYGTISDFKVKQDIVLAGSQWDDVKAISKIISKYSLKTDPETRLLGVVAQDLWKISPGLVRSSADKTPDGIDLGTTTLSVDLSTMYMKAVKALGEALERIETLEARLIALETK